VVHPVDAVGAQPFPRLHAIEAEGARSAIRCAERATEEVQQRRGVGDPQRQYRHAYTAAPHERDHHQGHHRPPEVVSRPKIQATAVIPDGEGGA